AGCRTIRKGYRGGPAEVTPTNGHRGPHRPTSGAEGTDRRRGRDRETARTSGCAGGGGHTDRASGGPGGVGGRKLGVRTDRETGSRTVKAHRGGPAEVAPANRHHRPHWPASRREGSNRGRGWLGRDRDGAHLGVGATARGIADR